MPERRGLVPRQRVFRVCACGQDMDVDSVCTVDVRRVDGKMVGDFRRQCRACAQQAAEREALADAQGDTQA